MKVLGISEKSECDCCGKKGLKRTVAVEFSDSQVMFFGTTCINSAWKLEPDTAKRVKKVSIDAYTLIQQAKDAYNNFNDFCAYMKRRGYGARILSPLNHCDVMELTWSWEGVKVKFSEFKN